jgi:hypothetical protein
MPLNPLCRRLLLENEVEVVMMPRRAVEAGIEDDKLHRTSRTGSKLLNSIAMVE